MNLDSCDVDILRLLQIDGRISYSKIREKTGIPISTTSDRIKSMIERGVIKNFTVMLDEEKIGFSYKAIVGVQTGAKKYRDVANQLSGLDQTIEVYGTTAEFDLMMVVQTYSREELGKLLGRIRNLDGVDDIYIFQVLETFKYEILPPLRILDSNILETLV